MKERRRHDIFMSNLRKINEHNVRYQRNEVSYKLGINKFADMTQSEFARRMNGFNISEENDYSVKYREYLPTFIPPANVKYPFMVDWRTLGAVTEVKDQGNCQSCWSFSATGALEGQHYRAYGRLVSLSEQNLIDCSFSYGNNGCNKGFMEYAFQYIKDNGGVDIEDYYPYEGVDTETCRFNKNEIGATISGMRFIKQGSEYDLMQAVAAIGPISAAIDSSRETFKAYAGGVYNDPECSQRLDHAILVVGYGWENGQAYWLIKNTWSTNWGEKGYGKIARNKNNLCGITNYAVFPLV